MTALAIPINTLPVRKLNRVIASINHNYYSIPSLRTLITRRALPGYAATMLCRNHAAVIIGTIIPAAAVPSRVYFCPSGTSTSHPPARRAGNHDTRESAKRGIANLYGAAFDTDVYRVDDGGGHYSRSKIIKEADFSELAEGRVNTQPGSSSGQTKKHPCLPSNRAAYGSLPQPQPHSVGAAAVPNLRKDTSRRAVSKLVQLTSITLHPQPALCSLHPASEPPYDTVTHD